MKQKKLLALLLCALLTLSLLTACGASSKAVTQDVAIPEAAEPMENMKYEMADNALYSTSTAGGSTSAAVQTGQKLIRKVNIDAETEDLETLLGNLTAQINTMEGYIESQELYNGSAYSSYRSRSANLTIRIPADKLDSFIGQIKDVSNVVSYNESQDDVTLTYVSTESRIKALETEQERLLELLSQAENMSDLLEIEARLTDVRYELENVTSQLLVLANKVDYATIYLYISQVKVYTEVEEQTVWQRISTGFKQNLQELGEDAEDFFVWLVTYSPQLILWAIVAVAAIALLRRRSKKRREQMAKIFPPQPPQNQQGEQ
ncbi:MAG: DUF4349 domain-containing protein [Oscillospiraceae bacterium]|nr:DUF4349 domain-containing protein [Oscillospiraceae bacterium]